MAHWGSKEVWDEATQAPKFGEAGFELVQGLELKEKGEKLKLALGPIAVPVWGVHL